MNRDADQLGDLFTVQLFMFKQSLGDYFESIPVFGQQLKSALGRRLKDLVNFVVDDFHRVFTELSAFVDLSSQKRIFVARLVTDWP